MIIDWGWNAVLSKIKQVFLFYLLSFWCNLVSHSHIIFPHIVDVFIGSLNYNYNRFMFTKLKHIGLEAFTVMKGCSTQSNDGIEYSYQLRVGIFPCLFHLFKVMVLSTKEKTSFATGIMSFSLKL